MQPGVVWIVSGSPSWWRSRTSSRAAGRGSSAGSSPAATSREFVALFMAFRAWHVLKVVLRAGDRDGVARRGAARSPFARARAVFLLVTVTALLLIGRAAWAEKAA